jgi:hypothetical protein
LGRPQRATPRLGRSIEDGVGDDGGVGAAAPASFALPWTADRPDFTRVSIASWLKQNERQTMPNLIANLARHIVGYRTAELDPAALTNCANGRD